MDLRCLELYSGIGGMHFALKRTGLSHEVAMAVDINNAANAVYKLNFPSTPCYSRNIESLNLTEIQKLNCNVWTMSPPCQPFTRQGKQEHSLDTRSQSFSHVLELLRESKPRFVFLENVKGFDGSDVWEKLVQTLHEVGYQYRQYLLTPLQFGIPNSRLRYYLCAWLSYSHPSVTQMSSTVSWNVQTALNSIQSVPSNVSPLPGCGCIACSGVAKSITHPDTHFTEYIPLCQPINDFLLSPMDSRLQSPQLWLTDKSLQKGFRALDIVTPRSQKTCCFIKGYYRKLDGAGSFLQTSSEEKTKESLDLLKSTCDPKEESILNYARSLGLRYFHPREVANLMCFPEEFSFPSETSLQQQLRLLGNSINVLVVAHLMFTMFYEALHDD